MRRCEQRGLMTQIPTLPNFVVTEESGEEEQCIRACEQALAAEILLAERAVRVKRTTNATHRHLLEEDLKVTRAGVEHMRARSTEMLQSVNSRRTINDSDEPGLEEKVNLRRRMMMRGAIAAAEADLRALRDQALMFEQQGHEGLERAVEAVNTRRAQYQALVDLATQRGIDLKETHPK